MSDLITPPQIWEAVCEIYDESDRMRIEAILTGKERPERIVLSRAVSKNRERLLRLLAEAKNPDIGEKQAVNNLEHDLEKDWQVDRRITGETSLVDVQQELEILVNGIDAELLPEVEEVFALSTSDDSVIRARKMTLRIIFHPLATALKENPDRALDVLEELVLQVPTEREPGLVEKAMKPKIEAAKTWLQTVVATRRKRGDSIPPATRPRNRGGKRLAVSHQLTTTMGAWKALELAGFKELIRLKEVLEKLTEVDLETAVEQNTDLINLLKRQAKAGVSPNAMLTALEEHGLPDAVGEIELMTADSHSLSPSAFAEPTSFASQGEPDIDPYDVVTVDDDVVIIG